MLPQLRQIREDKMGFVTKAEAYIISELKSTVMDRLHMGGSFLQQIPTVTVGGLPVAIKQSGLGAIGEQLGGVISQVQSAAGAITAITQNPMSLVEGAINSKIGDVSSKITAVTGKLSGGQLSALTNGITGIQNALTDFQAHTQLLSGQATSISDAIPDFNKLKDAGSTLSGLTGQSPDNFIESTIGYFAGEIQSGAYLPFDKAENFRLRLGEVTTWSGYSGHGKSMLLSYVTLKLIENYKVMICSFEMSCRSTLARYIRQSVGTNEPTESAIIQFCNDATGKLFLYDQLGSTNPTAVLSVIYTVT